MTHRIKKPFYFFITSVISGLVPVIVLADAQIKIDTNFPGSNATSTIPGVIANFYSFALIIAGILAFGAIVYGGIKYAAGRGNPSAESEGKSWITNALLGLLLLAGAWVVLYTINPQLVTLSAPSLPGITVPTSTGGGGGVGGGELCNDLQALAKGNNELYPAGTAKEINDLIACVHSKVSFGGSQFTYDQDHMTCNYTRGFPVCDSTCSHARNSCHYGGKSGSQGALAVDFGVTGSVAQQVVDAAYQCGIQKGGYPKARCEAADGVMVACVGGGATHVHVSAQSCDSN